MLRHRSVRALPSVQVPGRLTREEPQTLMNTLRPAWSTVFTSHLWHEEGRGLSYEEHLPGKG